MTSVSQAWVNEPHGRGTWGLVQSCLVTLFLCVYTAIHLNIHAHQSMRRSWLRRIVASLLACAWPEFMFVSALSQWLLAKELQSQLNCPVENNTTCERCGQNQPAENPRTSHQETQTVGRASSGIPDQDRISASTGEEIREGVRRSGTLNDLENGVLHRSPTSKLEKTTHHSISQVFFIVSGGLAIETMSFREEPYLTVTPTGAVELARLGLLDPVPEEIIDDKSKADPITKTLVCIQAGWFIVQCIARVAQHLPLSLLEIHTLAHVLVALSMYLFWYSKPYNALSPAVITKRDVVQAAALFTLSNQVLETASESRCLLSDELDLARVNAAHLRALSEKGQPTNDRQNLGAAAASDRQANDVNDILGVENQATESSTIRNDNDPSIMPGALAPGDVILQLTSNASTIQPIGQDGQPQQPKVSTSLPASEQISRNIEVHSRREHQPIYQFHGTNAPISEESSNISPKPHTSTRTENTLALAQLAIQRLKSHKVHFVYFQTPDKSIRHRSTYLVSAIADFIKTPGCQLNGAELATLRRSRPHKSMYDFLPSCPWSLLVYVLLVSYAGFHLSAWNTHFPTKNERIIWRAAGLLIVVWPLFAATIYCRAHYYAEPWAARQGAGYLALFVVGACRLYFLVEAFISLRGPAPRLYETVEWTQFWPHG